MSGATNASKHVSGFEETVKDFWASRPRRPHHGRKLAGVASGIGYRYGIDPVVVRVALVALTIFGGIGITVYLLGWLFLPGEDDEVSAFESLIGRGRSSVSKAFTVVLCVLLLPTFGWTFGGNWFDGGGILGLALLVTAIYLLHRSKGHLNRPAPVTPVARSSAGGVTAPITTEAAGQQTPSWDPLGAAPLAWDLPEPPPAPEPPAPPPPPRPKSKIGVAALGAALAVAGVGAALAASGTPWFTWGHVVGLVLAVLGTGLVLGSFLGGGRGLIWLAVPLSAAGLALTTTPIEDYSGGFGNLDANPRTAEEVLPGYERTAGSIDLDLRQLTESGDPIRTVVSNGAGDIAVHLPPNADVTFSCSSNAGDIQCLGRQQSGLGLEKITGRDYGEDGRGGQQIDLVVDSGLGTVEVSRG